MADLIPESWKPAAKMSRIHLHWTAGNHIPNAVDRRSYHILVRGDGELVRGDRPISANAKGSGVKQASHTLNANTGAIGVSLCCMKGAKEVPFKAGSQPMTQVQWDVGMQVLEELADAYAIPITSKTILTHAEVQPNLNIKQKNKWDIVRLAFDPSIKGFKDVGDHMRSEVAALRDGRSISIPHEEIDDSHKFERYRVSGVDPSTLNFRNAPNGVKVGELPERTTVEFIAAVGHWWQVRTRLGYVGWVWSEFLKPIN